jgi:hypothetical protein
LKWTRKKKLNTYILIAFVAVFVAIVLIPNDIYGTIFIGETPADFAGYDTVKVGTAPTITYYSRVHLETVGPFSANKDIYIQILISNANLPKWNDTYCCVAVVGSGSTEAQNFIFEEAVTHVFPNGSLFANGVFHTLRATPIWVALIPTPKYFNSTRDLPIIRMQLQPVVNVTDASATLSVNLTETAIKIGFIVGSFSILAVQPVLEGMFLEEGTEWPSSRGLSDDYV